MNTHSMTHQYEGALQKLSFLSQDFLVVLCTCTTVRHATVQYRTRSYARTLVRVRFGFAGLDLYCVLRWLCLFFY